MKIYVIALKQLGINNKLILEMIEHFEFEDFSILFKGDYLNLKFKYNINIDKYSKLFSDTELLKDKIYESKEIISISKKNKIKIALIGTKQYPVQLSCIDNPPAILYYKGRGFYKKHVKSVGCVGSRSITSFGTQAIEAIVPKLVSEGFTIISGLADGVDYLSHKVCLENEGTTIGVLAHGLDMIYPKGSAELADEILKNNGLLVSEYPIGTKPDKFRFIERNRVVSGLSKSLVVFETKEKSGTMHTVNYSVEQNKPVFCPYPQSITTTTAGLIKLISENTAIPIPTRASFETVVLGSGYKLKDKERAQKVRYRNASNIISNAKIDSNEISRNLNFDEHKYSSVKVDQDIYEKYKVYLKENNLTNKDLFNSFMLSVINSKSNNS